MGLRIDKVKKELKAFYNEVVVENGPRYKNWKEWHHLYIDFFVSFFSMSYTLGHLVAISIPIFLILNSFSIF